MMLVNNSGTDIDLVMPLIRAAVDAAGSKLGPVALDEAIDDLFDVKIIETHGEHRALVDFKAD